MAPVLKEADDSRDTKLVVFISYSRSDSAACESIVKCLEANEISVLIDRRDLPYGEEWQQELAHFIATCDRAIWLVSPASVVSKWCSWELQQLGRLAKKIVPVRIRSIADAELPESLAKVNVLPATGLFDEQTHLELLLESLLSNRAWVKQATRLSNAAQDWKAKEHEN